MPRFDPLAHSMRNAAGNALPAADDHAAELKIFLAILLSVCWSTGFAGLGGAPASSGSGAVSTQRATVQQDDLVIVSAGRMGAFEGKAWLPGLLPASFNTSDIR
jgi:uncharacterized protein DUF2844